VATDQSTGEDGEQESALHGARIITLLHCARLPQPTSLSDHRVNPQGVSF
jgi:hypothetical protein